MPYPAFIEDRYFEILAANPMATMLSPRLIAGHNQLRDMFLEPAESSLHEHWERITECLVASLRLSAGADIDDPRFTSLVCELISASPRFRYLWGRHDVRTQGSTHIVFAHPQLGRLSLNRERLTIGAADAHVVIYHADAGTPDGDQLTMLAQLIVA